MLNNISKLNEKVLDAIVFETGLDEDEIYNDEYVVDTLDSFEDIKKGLHSYRGKNTEYKGVSYFIGEAQQHPNEARQLLMLIKNDEFTIIVLY